MEAKAQQAWARHIREEHLRGLRFGPRPPKPLDPKRKIPKQEVPAVSITTPDELEQYVSRFHSVFRYRSTQEQALLYLLGLLSDLGRKNGEMMEAGIPSATQQGVWDFLVRSPWSAEALDRARVTDFLASCAMAGRPLDVVIDEVSELKQGKQSVGVARQYLGCAGKTANGQVTVSLHGLVGDYDVPLCGELYLPEAWATDADRRNKARVPEALPFRTKLEMAWQLLQRVNATWGLGIGRVYADPGYGEIKLMRQLDAAGFAYCLGVKSTFSVRLPAEPLPMAPQSAPYSGRGRPPKTPQVHCPLHTIAEIRACLPEQAWRKVAYRRGTDGTELAREFVAMRVIPAIKYQPHLEQRHAELKGPMEVAPVFLKDASRIEGLLCLEFLALLTRALIEREIRQAMQRSEVAELSLYPEDRGCRAPTATRVLDIFAGLTRHRLLQQGRPVQVFLPELSPLQRQVLDLLGIPATAYTT